MLSRFRALHEEHAAVAAAGRSPFGVAFDAVLSATEAMLDGRRILLLGTNNYLGLTLDPDGIEAAVTATREQGTGTTGSRIANGTYGGHAALETRLAAFLKRRSACEACGFDLGSVETGDGAATFIMQIAGFLVGFSALAVEIAWSPPIWLHLIIWLPLVAVLAVALMRPGKGLMTALQMLRQKGADSHRETR